MVETILLKLIGLQCPASFIAEELLLALPGAWSVLLDNQRALFNKCVIGFQDTGWKFESSKQSS
jgi:hypothetical protein